jgi:hypothetical protein
VLRLILLSSLVGFETGSERLSVLPSQFEMGGDIFHAHILVSLASRHDPIVEADVHPRLMASFAAHRRDRK